MIRLLGCVVLGVGLWMPGSLVAQPVGKALELFNLINEARTQPQQFLKKYAEELEEYDCPLIEELATAQPVEKAVWDDGLSQMAKESVQGNLDPLYAGKNELCGTLSSNGSGRDNELMHYLCEFHTIIFDSDYRFFGIYFKTTGDDEAYAYNWGNRCDRDLVFFSFDGKVDTSKVDFKQIQTAAQATYMSAFEQEMIREINFVRRYPAVYADVVARHLQQQSQRWGGIEKDEFKTGLELIAELKKLEPRAILQPKQCVYNAAKLHGLDCVKRGFSDHTGSDGSNPWDRIARACAGMEGNENLVGGAKNARAMVIMLLMDTGISSRGHRYNLLHPKWKYVGCYGYQGDEMWECVQNFATD